jgi:hypothetical protein
MINTLMTMIMEFKTLGVTADVDTLHVKRIGLNGS